MPFIQVAIRRTNDAHENTTKYKINRLIKKIKYGSFAMNHDIDVMTGIHLLARSEIEDELIRVILTLIEAGSGHERVDGCQEHCRA